jgi:hypothetical protein
MDRQSTLEHGFEPGTNDVALLPSGRVGRLTAIKTPSGRPIYRGVDGKLLCKHGELASSIVKRMRNKPGMEDSVCDCMTTEGLLVKSDTTPPPPRNVDLFRLLRAQGAITRINNRRTVYCRAFGSVWLNPLNTVVCKHGYGLKARESRCKCQLVVPKRQNGALRCRAEKGVRAAKKRAVAKDTDGQI